MRNKYIYIFTVLFLAVSKLQAEDIDVLIAKTSIALGDAYLKESLSIESEVLTELKNNNFSYEERLNLNSVIIQRYEELRLQALNEYKNVTCTLVCPENTGNLNLPANYSFFRREAYSKVETLLKGSLSSGILLKTATIYAANGEFEEHLLGRLSKLVSSQQSFDSLAKDFTSKINDLNNASIEQDLSIIGIDQSLLRDSNYEVSQQIQLQGYKSCVDSYKSQDQFEKSEFTKALTQYSLLKNNLVNNLNKIYDVNVISNGSTVLSIDPRLGWKDTGVDFQTGDTYSMNVTGKWTAKGAARVFNPGHMVYYDNPAPDNINTPIGNSLSTLEGILTKESALTWPEAVKQMVSDMQGHTKDYMNRLATIGIETGPEGYYYSFNTSMSKSYTESIGYSANAGVSVGFFNAGVGVQIGTSESISAGNGSGGTYGLKLRTTPLPNVPLGALIGSYCDVNPSNGSCPIFPILSGGVFQYPHSSASRLWITVNDVIAEAYVNTGAMNIEIKKSSKFIDYLDVYYEWMNKECDSNGLNCGFKNILNNIAFIPNPFLTAETLFKKQFPEFPAYVQDVLLQEINYLVQMNIILRDLSNKIQGQELNDVKVTYCSAQVKDTEALISSTNELMKTYSRMIPTVRSKTLMLDTARGFYKKELENLNWMRTKNLERIERYYQLTVNAFNYLYFSDFQPVGSLQAFNEGNYYLENIERMRDQIIDITTTNDLLNPNRGFVVYDLSSEELSSLQSADSRKRQSQVKVNLEDVMCNGFNLDDQTRVMIEKVGLLLDLDPAREHLFFTNPHVRNAKVMLTHGAENQFFDLVGKEIEYWMPSQKRSISAWSTQVLTDTNSDYQELRDSRYFERLSFRKTSFATSWNIDLSDPTLNMYTDENSLPILKGAKLVFWFNSTESQGSEANNVCLSPPKSFSQKYYDTENRSVTLKWTIPVSEASEFNVSDFYIYQSVDKNLGFRKNAKLSLNECSLVANEYLCEKVIDLNSFPVGSDVYFKVRSAYKKDNSRVYPGIYSTPLKITANK